MLRFLESRSGRDRNWTTQRKLTLLITAEFGKTDFPLSLEVCIIKLLGDRDKRVLYWL